METIVLQNVKNKPYILCANCANHKHFMSVVKCQSKYIHVTYILQNLAKLTLPFFNLCDFTNKMRFMQNLIRKCACGMVKKENVLKFFVCFLT